MTTRATRQFGIDRHEDVRSWVQAAVQLLSPEASLALGEAAATAVATLETHASSVQVDVLFDTQLLEVRIGGLRPEGGLETQSYWWSPKPA